MDDSKVSLTATAPRQQECMHLEINLLSSTNQFSSLKNGEGICGNTTDPLTHSVTINRCKSNLLKRNLHNCNAFLRHFSVCDNQGEMNRGLTTRKCLCIVQCSQK